MADFDENNRPIERIVLTRSESCRRQRARINKRLASLKPTGGTEYMQNKIQVIMPDRSIISDYATYSTFAKVLKYIGYEKVAALGLKYGRKPIVTTEPRKPGYSNEDGSWWVLANWPAPVAARYVNDIADALDLYIECDMVPK